MQIVQSVIRFLASILTTVLPSLGDICSAFGLFVSLYVLRELSRIKRKYLFKARIPELMKSIRSYSSALSDGLGDFEANKKDIEVALTKCDSVLKVLSSKVDGDARRKSIKIIKSINNKKEPLTVDKGWELYTNLLGLLEYLKETQRDIKWSE